MIELVHPNVAQNPHQTGDFYAHYQYRKPNFREVHDTYFHTHIKSSISIRLTSGHGGCPS